MPKVILVNDEFKLPSYNVDLAILHFLYANSKILPILGSKDVRPRPFLIVFSF